MLDDQGKCSALHTREGFFDFVVFRTQCNVPHSVAVVCQHDQKAMVFNNNNMSGIKVSIVDGFYSLQVYSSCDAGWFLIANICINFYPCPNCTSNIEAHEQCEKHGGQLAYQVLNNVTVTSLGNILDKNTELSLFFDMFHHMEDLSPPSTKTYNSFIQEKLEKNFALNGSNLCIALNLSKQCNSSDIVLSVSYKDVVFDRRLYWRRQIFANTRNSPNSPNIIARQNLLIYSICKLQRCCI